MAFEAVHTVTSFWDSPCRGVADFNGRPHVYERVERDFDMPADEYLLMPLDPDVFALALEDWAIWLRWDEAFHQKLTTIDTHPVLPADRERHAAIERLLEGRLTIDPSRAVRKIGVFRTDWDPARDRRRRWSYTVEWLETE